MSKPCSNDIGRTQGKKTTPEELKSRVQALYHLLSDMFGSDKLVLKAAKFNALSMMRSRKIEKRALGLKKIVLEDPSLEEEPAWTEIPSLLQTLEDEIAGLMARRALEESLEEKINNKLQQKHQEYIKEIKKELVKEEGSPENPQTLKKYALLEKMHSQQLSRTAAEQLRPSSLDEVIGQEAGIRALISKLSSPFPQHILLYGPPGIGKTTAARLALEAVKGLPHTPFDGGAPFVEVDGTTLRWDPRESTNPLLGSVHDPIYQGARKELSEEGVPEPKPGLVTEAHTGVLFIDEIGDMDAHLQSKLLKVLEDKKVHFESAYYDPSAPRVPKYIHKYFEKGAPADFVLIGATTRSPDEISPALRSRCAAVYFEPLSTGHIRRIVENAAQKLEVSITPAALELISLYAGEGRAGVNLLADAYGLALFDAEKTVEAEGVGACKGVLITEEVVKEVVQNNRLVPLQALTASEKTEVGKVLGVATSGYLGKLLEIEAVAFPVQEKGRGSIRFNEAAGTMARDSVFNAASVLRRLTGIDVGEYDLHINVVGGGSIDGPSAGAALFLALYSTLLDIPMRQDVAVSGELSLQGQVKPVGGLAEKLFAARMAGIKNFFLPRGNECELPGCLEEIEIRYVDNIEEIIPHIIKKGGGEINE